MCLLWGGGIVLIALLAVNERSSLLIKTEIKLSSSKCDIKDGSGRVFDDVVEYCSKYGDGNMGTIVIWGDSHAASLARPIINNLSDNESLFMIWHNDCPPLVGVEYGVRKDYEGPCERLGFGEKVLQYINQLDPSTVILAARWPRYSDAYSNTPGGAQMLYSSDGDLQEEYFEKLKVTTSHLLSENKVIVLPPKELSEQLNVYPDFLSDYNYFIEPSSAYVRAAHMLEIGVIHEKGLRVFDVNKIICPKNNCEYSDGAHYFYKDTNHLSDYGVDYISPWLLDVISPEYE